MDDLENFFPYQKKDKNQSNYIQELKKILAQPNSVGVVDLPLGTSKTVCLFSIFLSDLYQQQQLQLQPRREHQPLKRLILVVKTVTDIEKSIATLKYTYQEFLTKHKDFPILGLGYADKKNLCVNKNVNKYTGRVDVENGCHILLRYNIQEERVASQPKNPFINAVISQPTEETEGCPYFKTLTENKKPLKPGVYSLEELKFQGDKHNYCPFYYNTMILEQSNVIVCNYSHILDLDNDAKIPLHIIKNSIVVFDDAQNIDDIIVEFNSSRMNKNTMEMAVRGLERLKLDVNADKRKNEKGYKDEFDKLKAGFTEMELAETRENTTRGMLLKDTNPYSSVLKNGYSKPQLERPSSVSINEMVSRSPSSNLMEIEFDHFNSVISENPATTNGNDLHTNGDNENDHQDSNKKIQLPGNIRKPEHFILYLKKFIYFLMKNYLPKSDPCLRRIHDFLQEFHKFSFMSEENDACPFRFFKARLMSLLEIIPLNLDRMILDELFALHNLTQFCYFLVRNTTHYSLFLEPFPDLTPERQTNPTLTVCCLDPSESLAIVIKHASNVILVSESLYQPQLFADILGLRQYPFLYFTDIKPTELPKIMPLIVTKGVDHMDVSTETAKTNDAGVVRNFGHMLGDLCKVAPDGIVCYFPSYKYMEDILTHWDGMDILDDILRYKLIFMESRNADEFSITLASYKKACQTGRGAILFAIARGNLNHGTKLSKLYGRTVVIFGIPLPMVKSRSFLARIKYLKEKIDKESVKESDLVIYDSIRQSVQLITSVFKSKDDYGVLVLADRRYGEDKLDRLPKWLQDILKSGDKKSKIGITSDRVLIKATAFFKQIGEVMDRVNLNK
jgi:DNA excision repair protein ERCC-2